MTVELTADRASRRGRATRTRRATSSATASALFYEVYGSGEPTVFLLPTWSIIHSRHWKMQIPYLARHCRVLTFDGRGNGRSDRPPEPDAYREEEYAADALAVMDATGDRARGAGVALARRGAVAAARGEPPGAGRRGWCSSRPASAAAAGYPARCRRCRSSTSRATTTTAGRSGTATTGSSTTRTSSSSSSRSASPSRTRRSRREDCVGWGLETDAETLVATQLAPRLPDEESVRELCARVRCPVLVIHGERRRRSARCASGARARRAGGRRARRCSRVAATSRTRATRSR